MNVFRMGIRWAAVALALAAAETRAATTNIFNGVSTNITTANYWIGTATPFNVMIITNGAVVTNSGGGNTVIGRNAGANSNRVEVTGAGSSWTVTNAPLHVGYNGVVTGNVLKVDNGASLKIETNALYIGNNPGCTYNAVYVGGPGVPSAMSIGTMLVLGIGGASFNTLVLTNAVLTSLSYVTIGGSSGGSISNAAFVQAGGTWNMSGQQVNIGQSTSTTNPALGNSLLIDAGAVSNAGHVYVGSASVGLKTFNSLTVRNGGCFTCAGNLLVGHDIASGSSNNWLLIESGSLLEVGGTLTAGTATNNTIGNLGGIFQFTNAAPSITPNGFGRISLANGTIAFRAVTNVNIKANWTNSLANIAFSGTNTFRLNNATNAVSGQGYTFAPLLGPTNYVRLELVNGGTMYRGGDVTVGAGGAVLFSNTTASVSSNVTVGGTMSVADATVTFATNLILQGGFTLNWSTNAAASNVVTVLGTLTLPASGTVNASAILAAQPARVVLFTQPSGLFIGNPAGWTVSDPAYRAVCSGNTIILTKAGFSGSLMIVR